MIRQESIDRPMPRAADPRRSAEFDGDVLLSIGGQLCAESGGICIRERTYSVRRNEKQVF